MLDISRRLRSVEDPLSTKSDHSFGNAFTFTVLLRLLYSGIAFAFAPHLKLDPALIRSNQFTDHLMQPSDSHYALWGVWERFDALWYIHIAQNGYDRPDALVFYPMYPAFIRGLSLVGCPPLVSALLISTVASFFLFWGFQKLLRLDYPSHLVLRGMVLFAVWPASFILFAAYPESLVIALIIWSLYCARAGRWKIAGALGLLAGLTKAVGALVLVPLLVIVIKEKKWRALPWVLLSPLGAIGFAAWIRLSAHAAASDLYAGYWRTSIALPWVTLIESLRRAFSGGLLLDLNLAALILIMFAGTFGRLRLEYLLYIWATILLFLTKKTEPLLQSTMRYVLAAFPAYIAFARAGGFRVLVAGAVLLLALNLFLMHVFLEWGLVV